MALCRLERALGTADWLAMGVRVRVGLVGAWDAALYLGAWESHYSIVAKSWSLID